MKAAEKLIFILLPLILLSGCATAANLDEQVYPLMMAIDKGEEHLFSVSIKIPAAVQGQGKDKIVSAQGDTILSALTAIDTATPQQLSFYRVKYIIFSHELAFADGFSRLTQDMVSIPGLKPGADCLIAKDSAKDFLLGTEPFMGERLSKSTEALESSLKDNSSIPDGDFFSMDRAFESPYKTPLAIYCAKKAKNGKSAGIPPENIYAENLNVEGASDSPVLGSVVFNSDKAVKILTGYENRLLSMCMGTFTDAMTLFEDEDILYDIHFKRGRLTKVKVKEDGGKIDVHIDIRLYAFRQNSAGDSFLPEEAIAKKLAEDAGALLKEVYSLGADPLAISGKLAKNYLTIDKFESADIPDRLTKANFYVTVYVQTKADI